MYFFSFLFNKYSLVFIFFVLIGISYWVISTSDYIIGYRLYEKSKPENLEFLKNAVKNEPNLVKRTFSLGEENVSLVHMVCSTCNLEGVNYLISLDADFSQETSEGRTPLSILTTRSDPNALESIRAILRSKLIRKSLVTKPNRFGESPISISVSSYKPVYLKEYLKIVNENSLNFDKEMLLCEAVGSLRETKEGIEVISILISDGANPLKKTYQNKSAIEIAKDSGKKIFLDLLQR